MVNKCWAKGWVLLFVLLGVTALVRAQKPQRGCVTGNVMERYFEHNPLARAEFNRRQALFQQQYLLFRQNKGSGLVPKKLSAIVTIPVVVHIVMQDPSVITDEQVQSQLDVLNADFAGDNADRTNTPAAFTAALGRSQIRFCLAQRTPDNNPTSGIIRKTSVTTSTPAQNDPIKYSSMGGDDAWDVSKYLNIWVCRMADSDDLGYAFMPGIPGIADSDQGFVTAFHAFGTIGTATAPFNKGRTATHEIGHFFNLAHIWGSNDCVASCADSDNVADTPNQNQCTYGNPSFPQLDACSNTAPGIMFMNFMDYVNDAAMVMFTQGQADRMESALESFPERSPLMNSNGCVPPVVYTHDVQAELLSYPANSIINCNNTITPSITVRNLGSASLTSVTLNVVVDNGAPVSTAVTVNLTSLQRAVITGAPLTVGAGYHTIKLYTSLPNSVPDQNVSNDTLSTNISVTNTQAAPVVQGFEATTFPPVGWGISNNSDLPAYNPVRVTSVSHAGAAAIKFNSFQYNLSGKYAVLSSPQITVPATADSVKLTFWRAAAQKSNSTSDSLQVLISLDCGQTFTSMYKIGGTQLNPASIITGNEYLPVDSQWVADTVNLAPYLSAGATSFIVQFRAINGYGNNIYLDDINIYSREISEALKEKGVTVTPNPTRGNVFIQHFPSATNLKGIVVYSATGQTVWKQSYANSSPQNYIVVPLFNKQAGMYVVQLIYTDKTVTKKVLKLN